MESRQSVVLHKYDPNIKKYVEYPALVIGERTLEGHTKLVYQTVHFQHDNLAAHHALSGVDWADTLERTLDVPHKSDVVNQSFYWLECSSPEVAKLGNFLLAKYKKETGDETPVDCAIRLLTKLKPKE